LSIDPNFQPNRVGTMCENLIVWKSTSNKLGIYGTDMAVVDFDLCIGDCTCIEVRSVNMFDWHGTGDYRKVMSGREHDCIYCFGCEEMAFPKFAVRVTKQPS
jgi:NAD-dependent dihydropyrimidine dehydrogenase PreA subunit